MIQVVAFQLLHVSLKTIRIVACHHALSDTISSFIKISKCWPGLTCQASGVCWRIQVDASLKVRLPTPGFVSFGGIGGVIRPGFDRSTLNEGGFTEAKSSRCPSGMVAVACGGFDALKDSRCPWVCKLWSWSSGAWVLFPHMASPPFVYDIRAIHIGR